MCDQVQWSFLGLSLAGYNVLISLLMVAVAVWGRREAGPELALPHGEEARGGRLEP